MFVKLCLKFTQFCFYIFIAVKVINRLPLIFCAWRQTNNYNNKIDNNKKYRQISNEKQNKKGIVLFATQL